MKIWCLKKKFFILLAAFLLAACFEDESTDSESHVYPDGDLTFSLFPNDAIPGDSVDANLTHGVVMIVHPNATYELSFDIDEFAEAPVLELFRVYWNEDRQNNYISPVFKVKPKIEGNRYVYSFMCGEIDRNYWVTSLSVGKEFYTGRTRNVRFTGSGAFSDHFSINLIVAGEIEFADGDLNEFADVLWQKFRKYYTSVTLDTIYIRYAHKHPELGRKYPASDPWYAGMSSDDIMMTELGGWPEPKVRDAIDIILVHGLEYAEIGDGLLGLSDLFGANMGGGKGSTIVIGTHVIVDGMRDDLVLSMEDVSETILHETGHFFGLRHTTATVADVYSTLDYSIYEDGFTDTPVCSMLFKKSLAKKFKNSKYHVDYRLPYRNVVPRLFAEADEFDCPDADNFMFPVDSDKKLTGFSKQQLELIKKNLMIFPH